ncbi:MAG: helix-turn-helix domain-containing protein [Acidimicrobiia bacterium]|nr:helix-turn-helix domain-containing protein [Acidimicrobiia bacterium]MBT8250050.1 helix-turn-helix domain-containing protein [Acidimicrobiia bacterium]NNC42483.1 transcriptional regulator [Acidimicrobiia bacterium]NNL28215.1 transcriptional regulator [Acidimicrobiia bacterium]
MAEEFVTALKPLIDAIGATVVPLDDRADTDLVLDWEGKPAIAIRLDFEDTLSGIIAAAEQELGKQFGDLDRTEKQAAVRLLDGRGAFVLRRSIDEVAEAMGVSRITIYNYLNAIREAT